MVVQDMKMSDFEQQYISFAMTALTEQTGFGYFFSVFLKISGIQYECLDKGVALGNIVV